jgi:hypothetical protein
MSDGQDIRETSFFEMTQGSAHKAAKDKSLQPLSPEGRKRIDQGYKMIHIDNAVVSLE